MWDFLYIDDAIEALYRLCTQECPNGVYNFGSGDVRQLRLCNGNGANYAYGKRAEVWRNSLFDNGYSVSMARCIKIRT